MLTSPDRHNLYEAILQRKSIRDYSPDEVSQEIIQAATHFIKKIPRLHEAAIQFHLEKSEYRIIHNLVNPFGAFISVAPYFFALSVKPQGSYMVEAGYQSEHLMLYLTSQGLGTCFIGSFLNFHQLKKELSLPRDEELVILSPIGFPDKSLAGFFTGFMVNTSQMLYGITKRKSLEEMVLDTEDGLGLDSRLAKWSPLLEAVQKAPSWCNMQPWRFVLRENEVFLFVEHTAKDMVLKYESWGHDYRQFDAGIALCHFELAAWERGMKGKWRLLEQGDFDLPERYKIVASWKGV